MIPVEHILLLSVLLFTIGVLGVMLRRNVIVIFMSIELMLNAVNPVSYTHLTLPTTPYV